ncbi:MAG: hypothetical protein DRH37_03420 [Deltaproteobacteria bacterium]|nr:MAG: hypothetical protein DRH37_03420 [Deltaproteobacteria bacterium]
MVDRPFPEIYISVHKMLHQQPVKKSTSTYPVRCHRTLFEMPFPGLFIPSEKLLSGIPFVLRGLFVIRGGVPLKLGFCVEKR